MRKRWLFSLIVIVPAILTSCANYLYVDLSQAPDYDWYNYEEINLPPPSTKISIPDVASSNIPIQHILPYLDVNEVNTLHWVQRPYVATWLINKLAATGAPQNPTIIPEGIEARYLGETDKNKMFTRVNTLSDWESKDFDYKYNLIDTAFQPTIPVAKPWVDTQSSQPHVLINATFDCSPRLVPDDSQPEYLEYQTTNMEAKRFWESVFDDYQYCDYIYQPLPDAPTIRSAHMNGTKILCIFEPSAQSKFLNENLLIKDANGHYLIAQTLIDIAKYFHLDGYFWDDEGNLGHTNGYIWDQNVSCEILKEMRDIIKNSSDPDIKNMEVKSYEAYGNLSYDTHGVSNHYFSDKLAQATDGNFMQDYTMSTNQNIDWLANHPTVNGFDINNGYNLGYGYSLGGHKNHWFYNDKTMGTRDLREETSIHYDQNGNLYNDPMQEIIDRDKNLWTFKENEYVNSMSIFSQNIIYAIPTEKLNLFDKNNPQERLKKIAAASVARDYLDSQLFTGHNRFLTNQDRGSTSYDWNFDTTGMSYGFGNIKQERTILFDSQLGGANNFKTNFCRGLGRMFVDELGNTYDDFPWSNKLMADIQPTYKWDIENSSGVKNTDVDGFYDYYNAYRKSNSLSLGQVYDYDRDIQGDGQIQPTYFTQPLIWNIMGTNYSTNDKVVGMKIKAFDENNNSLTTQQLQDNLTPQLAITLDDGSIIKQNLANTSIDSNSWISFSNNLSSITLNSKKIAKIGIALTPTAQSQGHKFKFNVGEMTINYPSTSTVTGDYITSLNSDLLLQRSTYSNIRLDWQLNPTNKDQIDYYEIFLKNNDGTYKIGETTNTNYFMHNVQIPNGSKIIIKTINKYDPTKSQIQQWNISF